MSAKRHKDDCVLCGYGGRGHRISCPALTECCYVDGCEGEVCERLRLHVGENPAKEVWACERHAALLRYIAL